MNIIDGHKIASEIEAETKDLLLKGNDSYPGLSVILVGNDKPSHIYVKLKEKAANKLGIQFNAYYIEKDTSKEELLDIINFLNNDPYTSGILVQVPLPHRAWESEVINAIDPEKDVDGFHPTTINKLLQGTAIIQPGLAEGILRLIHETKEPLINKSATLLCNTPIFAKPIVHLLEKEGITCDVITNFTEKPHTIKSDIIITALGKKHILKQKHVAKDQIILIDVGIIRVQDKIYGDIDTKSFSKNTGYMTPVPGGVGPVTVAMLMLNTVKLYTHQQKKKHM